MVWISNTDSRTGWLAEQQQTPSKIRKHLSHLGHSFSDWSHTELLARSNRMVKQFRVIQNSTWKAINDKVQPVIRAWCDYFGKSQDLDYLTASSRATAPVETPTRSLVAASPSAITGPATGTSSSSPSTRTTRTTSMRSAPGSSFPQRETGRCHLVNRETVKPVALSRTISEVNRETVKLPRWCRRRASGCARNQWVRRKKTHGPLLAQERFQIRVAR